MSVQGLVRIVGLFAFLLFGLAACAQTSGRLDPMTEARIAELSELRGAAYEAGRNAFLQTAASLPRYPYDITERDPRFRVQYLILQGWQENGALYRSFDEDLDTVDADFMSRSAAGFSPVYNQYRNNSGSKWRRDGLPYGWEELLKFTGVRPGWRSTIGSMIVTGHPHGDSVDPLLIAIHNERNEGLYNQGFAALRKMPVSDLEERLDIERPFYTFVQPILLKALEGRR